MNKKHIIYIILLGMITLGASSHYTFAQQVTVNPLYMQSSGPKTLVTGELRLGSRGNEVSLLQASLAKNKNIYPQGYVTGYYGSLTKMSVEKFQVANKLSVNGIVSGDTLKKINEVYGVAQSLLISDIKTETLSPTSSIVSWKTDAPATTEIFYSVTEIKPNTVVSTIRDTHLSTSHAIEITHLSPATKYYYTLLSASPKIMSTTTSPGQFTTLGY